MQTMVSRNCRQCNKPLKGRTDKKFCDDYCRNIYNNQLKATSNNLVRNINSALCKNRRILESLIPDGDEMARSDKEKLLQLGYRFKFNTHIYTNKKGAIYFYCYEYGYLFLDNDGVLIVKTTE